MITRSRLFFLFVVLGALASRAETTGGDDHGTELHDFVVRTWTRADGLPDTSVTVILQSRDGYLWIGTGAGLARFDGVKFTGIPLPAKGRANAIVSITALCEDQSGGLWIGSQEHGLFYRRNGRIRRFSAEDGLLDSAVTSLNLDNKQRVWIGTRHGVNRWDGRRLEAFTTRDGLPDDSVLNVHAARSGTVWITTAGGMCRFMGGQFSRFHFPAGGPERDQEFLEAYEDRRGNLWAFCSTYLINLSEAKRINYFRGEKSAVTRIWSLCEGRGGRLWIGASGRGVFCISGSKFQPVTLNEGRWPNDVRAICEDHEGDLWLGISGVGLVQLRPQSFSLLTENPGLPAGVATCLMTNALGRLYVGMDSGGIYAGSGDRFEQVNDETKFLDQDLTVSLCAGRDGSLWVGTAGTGLYQIKNGRTVSYTTADGLSDNCIMVVCCDAAGAVWAGTRSGALHRLANGCISTFNRANGLPGTSITALLAAPDGRLWVGTANGVLLRADGQFQNVTPVPLPGKMSGKAILAFCAGTNHGLWIGTDGGGLGYLNEPFCRAWNSQDGLSDDIVSGLVEDEEGDLWVVTSKGLCRISRDSIQQALAGPAAPKEKLVLETAPGLPRGFRYGGPRALRCGQGRLEFALASGLAGVDIHGSDADKPDPQVHIEAALVDDQAIALVAPDQVDGGDHQALPSIRLPSKLQRLEIRYAALSFEAPEKVRFRHKLDGFDPDWVEGGSERRAFYGPLPSGNYEFHVTACNAEGVWNDKGASLALIVPTPLWRAPWLLALCGLVMTTAGAGTVRLVSHRRLRRRLAGLEQQQAMERERMRIARNMHDDIGSKLTKVSFLSELAKVEVRGSGKAEAKIDAIATTSRELLKTLDEIVWAVNPRNDTLEHLAAYLCQYAREYFQNTPVECDLHVQSKLPHVEMSAEVRHNLFLAFEESLNNVLKHSGASSLRLDISADSDGLLIKIQDNGRGFVPVPESANASSDRAETAHRGNGLQNMRQRLRDTGGQCAIQSSPGQGACVSLSMPFDPAKMRGR